VNIRISLLLVLLAISSLSAQEIAPFDRLGKNNVTVKAKQLSGGSKIDRNWQTSWGSYDRDMTSTKVIEVEVSGIGTNKGPIKVEFFFAIKDEANGLRYFEGQNEKNDLDRGLWLFSTTATRNVVNLAALGERYKSGEKIVGWLVRVIRDNTIVGVAASAPAFEKAASNPGELGS